VLHVQHLARSFGTTTVLADISFVLNDGEHVGLIGPNGTGKSTLVRCLVGQDQPDRGSIVLTPAGARFGYLPQTFAETVQRTLGDVLAEAQLEFTTAEKNLQHAAEELAASADGLDRYGDALSHFEALGGYERAARQAAVLEGLDLGDFAPETPMSVLSGGQKTRLGLAALLLQQPDLLVLDEPTNHLDTDALEWLESFLRAYKQSVLVVSHDRAFLDATVTRVLYLDPDSRTLSSYRGGYADFAAARVHERRLHEAAWDRQHDYVERVQQDISRLKSEARSIEQSTTARQPGLRKFARKKAAVARSRERKLERYLDSPERVEKPRLQWPMNLRFGTPPPGGRAVLWLEDVAFAYPGQPPLFQHVNMELRYGQRAAIVGPNGAGKTTLLRLIEGQLRPTEGVLQVAAAARVGVIAQEHESFDPHLTVLDTVLRERPMSEEEARSFLPFFLFYGDSVFRPVCACSPGERSRLQLAQLVLRGCNLLLLDEPINHLDVESREQFEDALQGFEGTIVVVAHDRAFLRSFARRTYEVRAGRVSALRPAAPRTQ
jgi:ATP-binding cassette subfamily F protein 3